MRVVQPGYIVFNSSPTFKGNVKVEVPKGVRESLGVNGGS